MPSVKITFRTINDLKKFLSDNSLSQYEVDGGNLTIVVKNIAGNPVYNSMEKVKDFVIDQE